MWCPASSDKYQFISLAGKTGENTEREFGFRRNSGNQSLERIKKLGILRKLVYELQATSSSETSSMLC